MRRHWTLPLLALAAVVSWAEESDRGVARVSLTNGDITMQRGDSGDWIAAGINAPLVSGDKIHAARASRAEVQFDHANFLRIGENTEVRLADLDGRRLQLQAARGLLTFRILRGPTAEVEINTPAVAVRPLQRGIYRIQVAENGETTITVRDGQAEIHSSQGTERLDEGRTMVVRLGPTDRAVEAQVARAAARDDWDRWNERRDDQISRARSSRYVHSSVYGVEDLDDHGYWRDVDSYGPIWFPRVHVGWAPYTYGRWAWLDWWGWSWVSYDPWGWAPFHHGRWFRHANWGWGWYPGPVHVYSRWSPALVGFFGWGGHSGLGVGFGYNRIGWVPLGPGESCYPWWGRGYGRGGRVYVDNSVNITNINVRNTYRNAAVDGGVITVESNDFARGAGRFQRASLAEVRNAGQIRGLVPVVPERESLRMSDREARASSLPRSSDRDPSFFTRRNPASADRVPFTEQQQQISRALRGSDAAERRATPGGVDARASRPGSAGVTTPAPQPGVDRSSSGWRRFGEGSAGDRRVAPQVSTQVTTPSPAAQDRGNSGWRRFEEGSAGDRRVAPQVTTPAPAVQERGIDRTGDRSGDRGNPGWRRFGEGSAGDRRVAPQVSTPSPAAQERGVDRSGDRGNPGWRRFGEGSAGDRRVAPQVSDPSPRDNSERRSIERREPDSGRSYRNFPETSSPRESPRQAEPRSSRPLEIHRPILQDRGGMDRGGMDRGGMDRGGMDRGGSRRESAPAPSSPRMSAPAPAPARGGDGGVRGGDRSGDRGGDRGGARSAGGPRGRN